MSARIDLPLDVVSCSNYLGEVILKDPVRKWINERNVSYNSGLQGQISVSATNPKSFQNVYHRVKPYIEFEHSQVASEFKSVWCN